MKRLGVFAVLLALGTVACDSGIDVSETEADPSTLATSPTGSTGLAPSSTLPPTTLDTEPPQLMITYPETTRLTDETVSLQGFTDARTTVFVNGVEVTNVAVADWTPLGDVHWAHLLTLSPGDNVFMVTAFDQAGNESVVEMTLHFRADVLKRDAGIVSVTQVGDRVEVTVDYVEVFGGEEAVEQARVDGLIGEDEGLDSARPDNPHVAVDEAHGRYFRNLNPRLRTFQVAVDARILLLPEPQPGAGPVPFRPVELVEIFADRTDDEDRWYGGHPAFSLFELAIDGTTVIEMTQSEAALTVYSGIRY